MRRNTGQTKMNGRFYGAVVRVADLEKCRQFYRDVIGLGTPVVDSSFWVEFECPESRLIVALEQDPAAEKTTEKTRGSVGVCLETEDLAAFDRRLARHGIHTQRKARLPSGRPALFYLDPEGNPVIVVERGSLANSHGDG
ncbi:MAG: hypothetical protein GXP31_15570 [Kiritimatiellaeota bacterium]|nr:hypothetical protein [Kiritimatiellota bacterium]